MSALENFLVKQKFPIERITDNESARCGVVSALESFLMKNKFLIKQIAGDEGTRCGVSAREFPRHSHGLS
jgi:hypothetical protein